MKLRDLSNFIDLQVLTGEESMDDEVHSAFASDLMSDVLAFGVDSDFLITGLANAQAIRTAEMLDIKYILFVRKKTPNEAMIELAKDGDVVIMNTTESMYNVCGKLYAAGLKGAFV
ncbi:MAG: hypothetical protein ACOX71_08410 [Lachnospiraceae bacterium]|jgi:hypothetical protein